jgi:XTP/dITP diphosphohydrolase
MHQLLVATKNPGKAKEFQEMLGTDWKVTTLLDLPEAGEVVEDGATFEANARKKALAFSGGGVGQVDGWVLADDSGLEVDYLEGAPGIYSARYATAPDGSKDDEANNRKLLAELEGVPEEKRGAQFRCVLALAQRGKVKQVFEGIVRGRILEAPRGEHGFGYDPLFLPEGFDRTTAELSPDEKHRISHRGQATRQASEFLKAGDCV